MWKVPLESGQLHVYVQFSHASVPIVDLLICVCQIFLRLFPLMLRERNYYWEMLIQNERIN